MEVVTSKFKIVSLCNTTIFYRDLLDNQSLIAKILAVYKPGLLHQEQSFINSKNGKVTIKDSIKGRRIPNLLLNDIVTNGYKLELQLDSGEVPDQFLCPVSREIMYDAVISQNGHTYSKKTVRIMIQRQIKKDPMSRKIFGKRFCKNVPVRILIHVISRIERYKSLFPPLETKLMN